MSKKNNKKTIIWLFPGNAIKSNIVLCSIIKHNYFYKNYKNIFVFDGKGKNFELAKKNDFECILSNKNLEEIKNFDYNFLIACGWGYKVNEYFIKNAETAAINAHSSFLPDYKGASVYYHYWANVEKYAGATIHFLTENFDEGNIIAQEKIFLSVKDSPIDILKKISYITSILIREAILKIENGEKGIEQKGGRYFYKANRYILWLHRVINLFLYFSKNKRRWLTKFKVIKK